MAAPPPAQVPDSNPPRGAFARFLAGVEWLGNLLPHPVTLFVVFDLLVLLLSGVAGGLGWSVEDPRPGGGTIEAHQKNITKDLAKLYQLG